MELFKSLSQEYSLLEKYIKQKAADKSPLQILEAGCGRYWRLRNAGVQHILTGVDLDVNALNLRKQKANDLDEVVVGDLRYINLEESKYDVIYSSFVLEHVKGAELVLNNFSRWLKPGGILILRIPDRNSVYGFVTRFTPFWFHIFYKRYVIGSKNAGKLGFGPYPTFHDPIISRKGIHEFCIKNSFIVKEEYGHGFYLNRQDITTVLIYLLVRSLNGLSLGGLAWQHDNLTYILEKGRRSYTQTRCMD